MKSHFLPALLLSLLGSNLAQAGFCDELLRPFARSWQTRATHFFYFKGIKDPTHFSSYVGLENFSDLDLELVSRTKGDGAEHLYYAAYDREGNLLAASYATSQKRYSIEDPELEYALYQLKTKLKGRETEVAHFVDIHTHPSLGSRLEDRWIHLFSRADIRDFYEERYSLSQHFPNARLEVGIIYRKMNKPWRRRSYFMPKLW